MTIQNSNESDLIKHTSKWGKEILDTIYKKANINKIMKNYRYLSIDKYNNLFRLLQKYELLFDSPLDK